MRPRVPSPRSARPARIGHASGAATASQAAAAARSASTIASGSSASKTAEPATNTSAPASAQRSMVSRRDAAVDLQPQVEAVLVDQLAGAADLRQAQVEELLAAEARLDGHHQQHVELGQQVLVGVDRGGRLERHPGAGALARSSRASRTGAAAASTWKVTDAGPRLDVRRRPAVGVLDHQVAVERRVRRLGQRLDDRAARGSGSARSGCPSRPRAASRRSEMRAASAARRAKSDASMLGVIWIPMVRAA